MICEISTHEVGVDSVGDVSTDHEAVGVHLSDQVSAVSAVGESFGDALEGAWEEIAVSALTEERAYFFIVEAADEFD